MESILNSIKQLLGIPAEHTTFDPDIIMNINTVFLTLNQIGVGTESVFAISSNTETWSDFLGEQETELNAVKSYIYLKVRMIFDPPQSSAVMEAIKANIAELEWRLNSQVDVGKEKQWPTDM